MAIFRALTLAASQKSQTRALLAGSFPLGRSRTRRLSWHAATAPRPPADPGLPLQQSRLLCQHCHYGCLAVLIFKGSFLFPGIDSEAAPGARTRMHTSAARQPNTSDAILREKGGMGSTAGVSRHTEQRYVGCPVLRLLLLSPPCLSCFHL